MNAWDDEQMNMNYTAIIKQQDNYWIGWIEEVPGVNCQELTREELLEALTITLREALELNRMDANSSSLQIRRLIFQ